MILLVTASDRAQECATVLQISTAQPTHCAKNLYEALGSLRSSEYVAVVLDQCLLDADPEDADLILQHLGTAIPVAVNCALCGIDRVAREVCAALKRRELEVNNARKSAEAALRSELREPLTAVLLNCDLLQEMCGLPRAALEKIAVIEEKVLDRQVASKSRRSSRPKPDACQDPGSPLTDALEPQNLALTPVC